MCIAMLAADVVLFTPAVHADNDNNTLIPNNKRFNDGVVANVYTMQHQAGCSNDIMVNPQLQRAAAWHARDLLNNRNLDGDVGSDGSTAQDRANAAGFRGQVAETVAIHPALAINGNELINWWYYNPDYFATMSNCAYTQMGVWSENSVDRSTVVAVYGKPDQPVDTSRDPGAEPPPRYAPPGAPFDPFPDYDGSDELEYGIQWLPWILRGVYPPPAYPPQQAGPPPP
jgi:uncharacterized protein YkwD